jgi:hypothetical protein
LPLPRNQQLLLLPLLLLPQLLCQPGWPRNQQLLLLPLLLLPQLLCQQLLCQPGRRRKEQSMLLLPKRYLNALLFVHVLHKVMLNAEVSPFKGQEDEEDQGTDKDNLWGIHHHHKRKEDQGTDQWTDQGTDEDILGGIGGIHHRIVVWNHPFFPKETIWLQQDWL